MTSEVDRVVHETTTKMDAAIEAVKKHFATVRTGRAHPSLVEGVKVNYYGSQTLLKQLANITVPEARLIVVQPWDKNSISDIEKALLASEIGITPMNDGKVIRLALPQLTSERKQELTKLLHKMAEEGRISVRGSRHHANEESTKLEKDHKLTEDEKFLTKDKVQELTDKCVKKIDDLLAEKEAEVMK